MAASSRPMSMVHPTSPYGTVIFCDQIRTENNGKLMLIGVYGSQMIFPTPFPQYLPMLSAHITYVEPVTIPAGELVFKVILTDRSGEHPIMEIATPGRPKEIGGDPGSFSATLNIPTDIGAISFQSAGSLSVIALRDGKEYSLGVLAFTAPEAPVRAAAAAPAPSR